MKKFFQVAMAMKETISLCYTGAMCFFIFFSWVYKQETVDLSLLFSLLLVCMAAGALQVLVFSNLLFKKLAYNWRLIVFGVPFLAVLTAFAVRFGWFPTDNVRAWVEFIAIFLVIFLFITLGIELYYRLSGRKWDDKLDWYRRNKGDR